MARPFAFLPGAAGWGSFWDPVRNGLLAAEVIESSLSLDWPGFGGVPATSAIASYEDLATLVIEQLAAPSVLVAQSMGGYVASLVIERRPDLVSHLVLSATSAGVDMVSLGAVDWRPGSRVAHPENPQWMWDPTRDLRSVLREVSVPTLLVWASDDSISPVAVGRELQSLIANSRLVVYPSDDHWVAQRFADEVVREIAAVVG